MKRTINKLLGKLGYRIASNRSVNVFDALILKYQRPGFTFVQIGANDGKRFDPIFHYVTQFGWRGLAVEPIREYFEELQRNYAAMPQVTCCNCAVYEEDKPVTLYRVDPQAVDLPEWTKGIASLFEDHHKKSNTPDSQMIAEEVQGIRLATLLAKHDIDQLDLLQIDTEGYDYHIVKMIDFAKCAPRIIRFEHGVRDGVMTQPQLSELIVLLLEQDYEIHVGQYDCFAAKNK